MTNFRIGRGNKKPWGPDDLWGLWFGSGVLQGLLFVIDRCLGVPSDIRPRFARTRGTRLRAVAHPRRDRRPAHSHVDVHRRRQAAVVQCCSDPALPARAPVPQRRVGRLRPLRAPRQRFKGFLESDVLRRYADHVEQARRRTITRTSPPLVAGELVRTGRLVTVEENPRVLGWGAQLVSTVAERYFELLQAPPVRVTTPVVPLPSARSLEQALIPRAEGVSARVLQLVG